MATTRAPKITLRFSTRREFEAVKRAAKLADRSLNYFVVAAAVKVAEQMIAQTERPEALTA